jgi:hypothetical protein
MSKHTPGPWKEAMWSGRVAIIHDHTDDGTFDVVVACNDQAPTLADARLIAAAPDLLAALKACEPFCKGHQETPEKAARYAAVRAAIQKAEGGDNGR